MLTPSSDLFQHRLDLPLSSTPTIDTHTPGLRFTTLLLPLNSFVLTNSGQTSSRHVDMMRHKVRTVGFALLGGGRDDPAAAQTAAALASQERGRRIAAGGVGMPGADEEPDAELEALLASDRPAGAPAPVFAAQRTPSAYHRVGAAAQAPVVPPSEVGPMEGYYELAVRSVQAVNYDSEEAD